MDMNKWKSLDFDKIIVGDYRKIEQIVEKNSIDLCVIKPPYYKLQEKAENYINFIEETMKKITNITKNGGFCCVVTSEDMTEKGMDVTESKALFNFIDN